MEVEALSSAHLRAMHQLQAHALPRELIQQGLSRALKQWGQRLRMPFLEQRSQTSSRVIT